jgi:small nuclear ribonucleoprotein (snRNP)-like protein
MMEDKVVAHLKNGKTLRGLTQDFHPNADQFHLLPSEGGGVPTTIRLDDLKALFYVKEWGANRRSVERAKKFAIDSSLGKKTVVEFNDGEKIWGFSQGYSKEKKGFYFYPADPGENNTRIFIMNSFVKDIRFDD